MNDILTINMNKNEETEVLELPLPDSYRKKQIIFKMVNILLLLTSILTFSFFLSTISSIHVHIILWKVLHESIFISISAVTLLLMTAYKDECASL